MPTARRRFWTLLLRLPPALAFAIAVAIGTDAAACAPEGHSSTCKCPASCHERAKSCCRRPKPAADREEKQAAPAAPTVDGTAETVDGPSGSCVCAAPRGEDVAPVKTATVERGDAAWLGLASRRALARGDRLPPPSSERPATGDGPRLDRPPRSTPSA